MSRYGDQGESPDAFPGWSNALSDAVTRRRLLVRGAQGLAGVGTASLLAACGAGASNPASPTSSTASGGSPIRGGTLTLGIITGGTAETLNPGLAVTYTDILRVFQLYNFLFLCGSDVRTLEPSLATAAEPNRDATMWTLHLRDGVHWHDGKPFTADDVVWTIKSWSSSGNYAYGIFGQFVDFNSVRKRGPLTVEVPLVRPSAQFPSLTTYFNCAVIQNGATHKSIAAKPIGTGPFRYQSFTPGSRSVFTANPHYWADPSRPYVKTLVVDSSFTDETSRNNALLSSQVDVSPLYPAPLAKQEKSSGQVQVLMAPGTGAYYFTMLVNKGPLADNRVRQALKLAINRQEMVDNIFAGYGRVGNDFYTSTDVEYALGTAPTYDVEKAKSLLKSAGKEGVTLTLQTAPAQSGYVESATLLAQQVKAAGINISLQQMSAATYFTTTAGYLNGRLFGQDSEFCNQSMTVAAAIEYLKGCAYNESNWSSVPGGQTILDQALRELNAARAKELWAKVQQQQISDGGLIVWGWPDWIDAAQHRVKGLTVGRAGPLNNYDVTGAWLSA